MTNTAFNTSLRFMLFTVILISLILINEFTFATTQKLEKFLDRDLGEVIGNGLLKFFDRNFWIMIGIGAVAGLLKANGDLRE